jgi:hypothetical protein
MSLTHSDSTSLNGVTSLPFPDRRQRSETGKGEERRQFGNSYFHLSSAGKELAEAIDNYKIQHRRRYVTPDELLSVITSLGYSRH